MSGGARTLFEQQKRQVRVCGRCYKIYMGMAERRKEQRRRDQAELAVELNHLKEAIKDTPPPDADTNISYFVSLTLLPNYFKESWQCGTVGKRFVSMLF